MSARDRIRLAGLSAVGHHGVFDHERRDGQPFVTDVVLHLDAGPAAAGDDLARTANYAEVADTVVRLVTGEPVDLIETLADLDKELYVICEQDMYGCDKDFPYQNAVDTRLYLASLGLGLA